MTSPGTPSAPGPATVRLVDGIAPAFARHGATGQLRLLVPGESTTL